MGGRRRTKGGSVAVLALFAGLAGWNFIAKPAMIRAEEWTGTIVSKDTGRPFFSSRRNRRQHYYWKVDCGDKTREVEVTWQMYNEAKKGQQVVKVKGERWPRLP
jgi:hypothetical protein